MKRLSDEELDNHIRDARSCVSDACGPYYNIKSTAHSNLVIVELLNQILEKE